MTAKELTNILNTCDPDIQVVISQKGNNDPYPVLYGIKSVEQIENYSLHYNLAVIYDESENAYFSADNKEADILDAVFTTNGITFDRFIDPLY